LGPPTIFFRGYSDLIVILNFCDFILPSFFFSAFFSACAVRVHYGPEVGVSFSRFFSFHPRFFFRFLRQAPSGVLSCWMTPRFQILRHCFFFARVDFSSLRTSLLLYYFFFPARCGSLGNNCFVSYWFFLFFPFLVAPCAVADLAGSVLRGPAVLSLRPAVFSPFPSGLQFCFCYLFSCVLLA